MSSAPRSPIAFCENHGFFIATVFDFGPDSAIVTAQGNFTDCPTCHAVSEVLSGNYHFKDKDLSLVLDKTVSLEALRALKNLAERVQRDEVTLEEAKEEAEKITPNAGKWFDIPDWNGQAKATLYASIIGAIAIIAASKITTPGQPVTPPPIVETFGKTLKNSTALGGIPVPMPRPTKRLKKIQ